MGITRDLKPHEQRVAELIADGKDRSTICDELGITKLTYYDYCKKIAQGTGLSMLQLAIALTWERANAGTRPPDWCRAGTVRRTSDAKRSRGNQPKRRNDRRRG